MGSSLKAHNRVESSGCGLTPRSTGPATASAVSLVRGTWCIIAYQAYGTCLRGPVNSNVRPHQTNSTVLPRSAMPIVDACIVIQEGEAAPSDAAKAIANAIAATLGAAPGRVWVRLQLLPHSLYAENGDGVDPCPVFLRVLHADPKQVEELEQEAGKLAQAVGTCLGRSSELVHIEYAPSGRGRVAFGGRLLT
jgi:hypothetical protein